MGQTEREEGVQSHLKKAGTPTMGGVIILGSILLTSLLYVKDYPKIIPVLFLTLGFGSVSYTHLFMEFKHTSVLLYETVDGLDIRPDGIYVDATLGGGGHAFEVCRPVSYTHLKLLWKWSVLM